MGFEQHNKKGKKKEHQEKKPDACLVQEHYDYANYVMIRFSNRAASIAVHV
jgi:hypothetical protein